MANDKIAVLDYEKAKEYQDRALSIFEKLNYKEEKVGAYTSIGQSLLEVGNYNEALLQFNKALEVATNEVKDNTILLDCHLNLAHVYDALGKPEEAFKECEKANEYFDTIYKSKKDKNRVRLMLKIWNRLSQLRHLASRERFRQLIDKYEEVIELCEEDSSELAFALKASVNLRLSRSDPKSHDLERLESAEKDLNRALTIFKNKGLLRMEVVCLRDLALIYMTKKDFGKAAETLKTAKEILCKEGGQVGSITVTDVNNQIALVLFNSGREEDLKEALKILKEDKSATSQMWWSKWSNYLALGAVSEKEDKLEDAYKNFAYAVQLIEDLRFTLGAEELRTGFVKDKTIAYSKAVEVLYKLKRFGEAFEYAERARGRILTEQIALTKLRRPKELDGTAQAKEEDELLEDIQLILSQSRNMSVKEKSTGIDSALLSAELAEKEKKLSEIWKVWEKDFKGNIHIQKYLSLRRGDTVGIKDLSKIIQRHSKDAAVLEYFPGKHNGQDGIFIFVMGTKDEKVKAEFKPVKIEEYKKSLQKTSENRLSSEASKDWRELGKYLIDPVKEYIKEYKVLCIIPYGDLSHIPIHALYTEGNRYLIETHAVVYCPSASILKYIIDQPRQGKGALIIGNPTEDKKIALSVIEATKVASLLDRKAYEVEVYTGKKVTKEFMMEKKWPERDIVHLSCHGMFDEDNPLRSAVQFVNDTLTAMEIFDQHLESSLVVLSACETAKSAERAGELYGLPRAFLYAGTPSLMCTLWKVSDLSTTMLLEKFYEELTSAPPGTINKAEALRRAQTFILKTPKEKVKEYLKEAEKTLKEQGIPFAEDVKIKINKQIETSEHPFEDPYYWAPFILIGDWWSGI